VAVLRTIISSRCFLITLGLDSLTLIKKNYCVETENLNASVKFVFPKINQLTPSMCIWLQVVQEYERAVIFRLGRIVPGGAKGPGKMDARSLISCSFIVMKH